VDFYSHGRLDLVSRAEQYDLPFYVYRRIGGGNYAACERFTLESPGVAGRRIPVLFRVWQLCLADWNGDGKVDALVSEKTITVSLNEGTNARPVFGPARPILAAGKPILSHGDFLAVVDWDGDGLRDLLVSGDQGLLFYRNIGTNAQPVLAGPRAILRENVGAFCAVDWNEDGLMDLIVCRCNPGFVTKDGKSTFHFHGSVWLYLRQRN
jgi:hypothetical protein